ncbi:MAG: hypothetical protein M3237_03730 [Actinomycetota bacterium]|nr:hypothetical protein [Actinomycetota bacterium]
MSEYAQERKGFWREPDGTPTAESVALEAWARAAHEILVTTAETYHGVIREPEIAEKLQTTTGIRTTRPFGRWLDKVLGPVSKYCEMSGEPPLTSLVVGQGDDLYAARLRLECYRWAGSAPAGGGEPAPLSITVNRPPRAAREPKAPAPAPKRVAKSDRPIEVCSSCFMALPATGICDNCS